MDTCEIFRSIVDHLDTLLCDHSELVKFMVVIYIGYEMFAEMVACGSRVKHFL